MGKLKTMAWRIRSMSFARMWMHVTEINKESGRLKISIFTDMIWCALRYGVGYLDYHVFGFAYNRGKSRKTFMTMNHNLALVHALNDRDYYYVFDEKEEFNRRFAKYIGRSWIDLREAGENGFAEFIKGKTAVFGKSVNLCGGEGIGRVDVEGKDPAELYARLMDNRQFLVEDAIVQHSEMNKLCPTSVNTVRIVTILKDDGAHFVYALVRMGSGNNTVDNISSGGMYTSVFEDGCLHRPAFCDKTGMYYDRHPLTGTVFDGFKIPMFKEAVDMCLEAATVEPHMRYVGWDVAITENGPILIEGNNLPGYDMCQNHRHLKTAGVGILPRMREIAGDF